ncbi:hypothetical protein BDV95DRAFT_613642 [Massariosphaeria phaeospora]|uniref:Uncharacterized protein n=1 Tax=Massariosphaeria phaeospora TaxID=100035 RepID=A0A7C8MGW8_9PLEO|nr:hypothetical protein BDV95DRAFT_613642 [Massariosphaeria phaeospora]
MDLAAEFEFFLLSYEELCIGIYSFFCGLSWTWFLIEFIEYEDSPPTLPSPPPLIDLSEDTDEAPPSRVIPGMFNPETFETSYSVGPPEQYWIVEKFNSIKQVRPRDLIRAQSIDITDWSGESRRIPGMFAEEGFGKWYPEADQADGDGVLGELRVLKSLACYTWEILAQVVFVLSEIVFWIVYRPFSP